MLVVNQLEKYFKKNRALHGVSFEVKKGQIYGLLGHNGAGKSTTIGIILGMIEADGGDVLIGGVSVQKNRNAALRKVGAIFEAPAFYDYLSGWQNLEILMNYSVAFDAKQALEIVKKVNLEHRIHDKVHTYSHGMRQRLALAQALLPEPELLLLDEPTDGLDPEGIKWFRDFILNLRAEKGTTVLFNSHLLNEVEQMCDQIAILQQGTLVYEGNLKDVERSYHRYYFDASYTPDELALVLCDCGATLEQQDILQAPLNQDPSEIIASFIKHQIKLRSFYKKEPSLEDLYMTFKRIPS